MTTVHGSTSTSVPTRHRRRAGVRAALAAVALVGALVAGCSSGGGSATVDQAGSDAGGGGLAQGGAGGADSANQPAPAATAGAAGSSDAERQVVKNGELYLTVDDPIAAADRVAQLADRLGGRVDEREQQAGSDGDAGSATMTIRVPADSLDDAVSNLGGLGDVTRYSEKTQDVTGSVVDLDARITAAQTSVDRVQGFLERASSTTELLDTEQALQQRQSELEQLRGQRATLADQVAMSTLYVSLTAPGHPAIEAPAPQTFASGLGVGWHSLLAALRGLSIALGGLLPLLVVAAIVAVAIVVPTKLRRRNAPARPPAPALAATAPHLTPPLAPPPAPTPPTGPATPPRPPA